MRQSAILASVALALTPAVGLPQSPLQAVTDNTTYNAGSEVRLRIIQPGPVPGDLFATIRYIGDSTPVVSRFRFPPSAGRDYRAVWKIPADARTGRYEIDLDGTSRAPHAASFAVHRKLVRVESVELDRTFYTGGDTISCRVRIRNVGLQPLTDLRVDFEDANYPWIARAPDEPLVHAVSLGEPASLQPGEQREFRSANAATAPVVKQPDVHAYAAVIRDAAGGIYDLAFTRPVFVHPPGVEAPRAYPFLYLYPELRYVNEFKYRHFYPPALDSASIEFDRGHTMFAAHASAEIGFTIVNPSDQPWREIAVRSRLFGPDGKETGGASIADHLDLKPAAQPLRRSARLTLPAAAGLYRLRIDADNASGQTLASGTLELAVNDLPKSILIFCAHEDDDGAHAGIIRAAAENRIPIHIVYFTGGDAGGCGRYFEHSCDAAEAMEFGGLRMDESRASLDHLGVPRQNLFFLGLPDGGLGQIWHGHIEASNPWLSVLLASDHSPYAGLATPNLPYARKSAIEAAKRFIREFHPEAIYTGHPDERHVDHRTNNWIVVKALQELLREGVISDRVVLQVDQVYGPGPQKKAPYKYEKRVLHVSGEAMALAQEAEWFYQSQDGNHFEGALATFGKLPREEVHWRILDWKDHEGWNE